MHKTLPYLFLIILFCANTTINNTKPNNSFSIIILPDTQYYSLRDGTNGFPNTYKMQTQWIADNATDENIQFVIHVGDMTHRNTVAEWMIADAAHDVLDAANIPYSVVPGNHDYPGNGGMSIDDAERYNQYFGTSRFAGKNWYGGAFENDNANNYCYFNYDGFKFLIISLEFAPSKDVLCWADQLIASHPDHNVILATHCYQQSNDTYATCNTNYNVVGSSGDDIWNELARRHSNVIFVFSGHVPNTAYRKKAGNDGNCVHELLTDYQYEVRNGIRYGNGWMRKLNFTPSLGIVDVDIFSVLPGISTLNQVDRYNSNPEHPDHKFTLQGIDLNPAYKRTQLSNTFNDLAVDASNAGDQLKSEVACAANGDFVVVWEDDQDGNGFYQVYARGFYVDGCEKFARFTVNQRAAGQQLRPHIDMAANGDFVVVWEDDNDVNNDYQVLAAGFDQFGNRRFNDLTVNAIPTGQHLKPRVGVQDDGSFVVVWEDDYDGNGFYQIYAAGFNQDGTIKIIQDFTVNDVDNGQQLKPDLAMAKNGEYIIVWEDDQDGNGSYQILATGFAPNSNVKLFNDITVNQVSAGQQFKPKVAIDQTGAFTVVWEDDNNADDFFQVLGANFNLSGQKVGSDLVVKPVASGQLKKPDISKNDTGEFVVTWEDDADGNGLYQIKARGYTKTNARLFDERTINEDFSGDQKRPVVSLSNALNYIVCWEDDLEEDGKWKILANGHDLMEMMPPTSTVCDPSCRDVLNFVADQHIDHVHESRQTINSYSTINANVTYSAGQSITLHSGFSSRMNYTFLAMIEGCD